MTKETWKGYVLTDNDWGKVGRNHIFKSFKVFYANEKRNIELLYKRDREGSFTGQFLKAGFSSGYPISPTSNWFGVSVYSPDMILKKDNKKVHLSLQGMAMPMPYGEDDGVWDLVKQCKCKYIGLFIDDKPIYQNWTGNLPPKELVELMIK